MEVENKILLRTVLWTTNLINGKDTKEPGEISWSVAFGLCL